MICVLFTYVLLRKCIHIMNLFKKQYIAFVVYEENLQSAKLTNKKILVFFDLEEKN